jgi:ribonucleoside-triphosphate reductase (thioredoxin)
MNPASDYQKMIHMMKYAKVLPTGERETWEQSVDRLYDYLQTLGLPVDVLLELDDWVIDMIKDKQVMPSMRLLSSAGVACDRENLTAFNCMFLGIDSIESFGRLMYALMCGTGVGFSVERMYTDLLPQLPQSLRPEPSTVITIEDTRLSWAEKTIEYFGALMGGRVPRVDYSRVRAKGEPLKTTGGYASGPEPLRELHKFILGTIGAAHGWNKRLQPIEIYDICCKIADVVVQGGVRRSACICLFDGEDPAMLKAKTMEAMKHNPWRSNANNSAVYADADTARDFLGLLLELAKETGEPGCVTKSTLTGRMAKVLREPKDTIGLNPCAEIILVSNQVCNLTEVVLRPEYSLEDNMNQVEAAVLLGLIQSTLTNFSLPLLADLKANTEREGLLGVSLTGIMDDPVFLESPHALTWLREYAHECALKWSQVLEIPCPKAITCVKPSGTVSKLVDCSPGIHPRFARLYLSNIGVARGTPMESFLRDQGVMVRATADHMTIFSFPMSAPEGAIVASDLNALQQLEHWSLVNEHWCDHNASCTIYVAEGEWPRVHEWCHENMEKIAGVTFMSKYEGTGGLYMPLEQLTEQEYLEAVECFPVIDWSLYSQYDDRRVDTSKEFACTGGSCELNILS